MSFYNQFPVDGLIYFACQTAVNDAPNIPKVDAHIESSAIYNYIFYCLLRSARRRNAHSMKCRDVRMF